MMTLTARAIHTIRVVGLLLAAAISLYAQAPAEQDCYGRVQGQVAWDRDGTTSWAEHTVRALCQGVQNPAEPARCFQTLMSGAVDAGTGSPWDWWPASDLCAGTNDADGTLSCFRAARQQGAALDVAIQNCSPASRKQRPQSVGNGGRLPPTTPVPQPMLQPLVPAAPSLTSGFVPPEEKPNPAKPAKPGAPPAAATPKGNFATSLLGMALPLLAASGQGGCPSILGRQFSAGQSTSVMANIFGPICTRAFEPDGLVSCFQTGLSMGYSAGQAVKGCQSHLAMLGVSLIPIVINSVMNRTRAPAPQQAGIPPPAQRQQPPAWLPAKQINAAGGNAFQPAAHPTANPGGAAGPTPQQQCELAAIGRIAAGNPPTWKLASGGTVAVPGWPLDGISQLCRNSTNGQQNVACLDVSLARNAPLAQALASCTGPNPRARE